MPRFGRTTHLVELIAEAERLVGRLRGAGEPDRMRLATVRGDEALLASLRLDGSPLTRLPDLEATPSPDPVAGGPAAASGDEPAPTPPRSGTWLDAMGTLAQAPDEQVQALECLGVRAGLGSEDLGERLLADPVPALGELHRRLTLGLVAEERAGAPREVEQAVHDASTGRVLYFTCAPGDVPAELAGLGAWLASVGPREHALITSGVLHLQLLRIHPFDAANGRLARTAARLVLRARGLDPEGLACPEIDLAEDPMGYLGEVASTSRRQDASIWLERWAEAVTAGLRDSARRLGVLEAEVPDRARRFVDGLDAAVFTVVDYRAAAGGEPTTVADDLTALLDDGSIRRVAGSRGLRFARSSDAATA